MHRALKNLILLSLVAAFATTAALAVDPINTTRKGVAVEGYDVVAYHTEGKPMKGRREFTHEFQGAEFRFANAANRDLFAADPEKYAPQYGGYCAFAVAKGSTAPIDPLAWDIVDGKLYLNYSKKIRKKWQAEQAEFIRQADANWPGLLAK
ncbi:hypothetical protein ABI59_15085 [Acidobacteria bacterium Mor1]|nr:hypothetical protein ABI59_15085 [Acidobacteria bacterium Mor1]